MYHIFVTTLARSCRSSPRIWDDLAKISEIKIFSLLFPEHAEMQMVDWCLLYRNFPENRLKFIDYLNDAFWCLPVFKIRNLFGTPSLLNFLPWWTSFHLFLIINLFILHTNLVKRLPTVYIILQDFLWCSFWDEIGMWRLKSMTRLTITEKIPTGKELQLTIIKNYFPLAKPKDQDLVPFVSVYLRAVTKEEDLAFQKGWMNC